LQGNSAFISQKKWHHYVIPYIEELRKIIKNRSEKTYVIYMMPWAYKDGLTFIEGETDTYEEMQLNIYNETIKLVINIDIALAPAGWAWYTAFLEGYDKDLYLNDLNHQSKYGAYLTACVFYSTVFSEMAPRVEYDWEEGDNSQYLSEVAFSTVTDNLDLWNIY